MLKPLWPNKKHTLGILKERNLISFHIEKPGFSVKDPLKEADSELLESLKVDLEALLLISSRKNFSKNEWDISLIRFIHADVETRRKELELLEKRGFVFNSEAFNS